MKVRVKRHCVILQIATSTASGVSCVQPVHFITWTLLFAALTFAQAPPARRSHVERFSTPEVRAERSEAEATARLAVDPNDAAALYSRALARSLLGRNSEAYQDLQRAVSLKP